MLCLPQPYAKALPNYSPFGMKIVGHDPFIAPDQARDLEIEVATLDNVFARADFLTVHTPLTAETRGIVGPAAFKKMKQGVRVINCARGGLVDEKALYDALKAGRVAGDRSTEISGKLDQVKGRVETNVGKAKQAVRREADRRPR